MVLELATAAGPKRLRVEGISMYVLALPSGTPVHVAHPPEGGIALRQDDGVLLVERVRRAATAWETETYVDELSVGAGRFDVVAVCHEIYDLDPGGSSDCPDVPLEILGLARDGEVVTLPGERASVLLPGGWYELTHLAGVRLRWENLSRCAPCAPTYPDGLGADVVLVEPLD
jgi:hypothetical protein